MGKIEVIVFDVDGTLLDTREFISQAYEHVLQQYGLPARSRAEIASQIGKTLQECYEFLAPGGDFLLLKPAHDVFQDANLHLIRQFDSVPGTINELRRRGYQLALWTGRAHNLYDSLQAAALNTELFEVIIDPTHISRGKPDPQGLQHIAKLLDVPVSSMMMVGDAVVDIIAGKRAGVAKTVGITYGFGTREELERSGPDALIDDFNDLLTVVI